MPMVSYTKKLRGGVPYQVKCAAELAQLQQRVEILRGAQRDLVTDDDGRHLDSAEGYITSLQRGERALRRSLYLEPSDADMRFTARVNAAGQVLRLLVRKVSFPCLLYTSPSPRD